VNKYAMNAKLTDRLNQIQKEFGCGYNCYLDMYFGGNLVENDKYFTIFYNGNTYHKFEEIYKVLYEDGKITLDRLVLECL
jgi:hypothetical protein